VSQALWPALAYFYSFVRRLSPGLIAFEVQTRY